MKYIGDGMAHFPGFGIDGDSLSAFVNGGLRSGLAVFDEEERRTGSFGVEDEVVFFHMFFDDDFVRGCVFATDAEEFV